MTDRSGGVYVTWASSKHSFGKCSRLGGAVGYLAQRPFPLFALFFVPCDESSWLNFGLLKLRSEERYPKEKKESEYLKIGSLMRYSTLERNAKKNNIVFMCCNETKHYKNILSCVTLEKVSTGIYK